MHKILLSILLVVTLIYALPAIAVRDLQGVGISSEEAEIVSGKLQTEFVQSNRFEVLERSAMEEITKEMELASSGLCDDANCLVELGKMLSVEKLIVGTVGKLDGSYTLSIRLLDIETGTIENSYASKRVSSLGALYDSLIPEAVRLFIAKFDFEKHALKEAGRIGGITPKLSLLERPVVIAGAGNYIRIHPVLEQVEGESKGKRLTYKLGDSREKAIASFAYSNDTEKMLHVKHHRLGKRVEIREGYRKKPQPEGTNGFVIRVPDEGAALPLVVTLTCESGAVASDTAYIVPRKVANGEIDVTALADLISVNKLSRLSNSAEKSPVATEYLNLHISYKTIDFLEYCRVMGVNSSFQSGWKERKPADISEYDGDARTQRIGGYNDSLKREEDGISWFNAVLYCNEKSKAAGLDTMYTYAKVKGRLGSPACKLVDVKLRTGNGYRLLHLDEAKKIMQCGTELYDNNLGLEMAGYEWASEKGRVFSPVGDKRKFPPHTYKLQRKSTVKGGIVPAFRVVRAIVK